MSQLFMGQKAMLPTRVRERSHNVAPVADSCRLSGSRSQKNSAEDFYRESPVNAYAMRRDAGEIFCTKYPYREEWRLTSLDSAC